ncbi:hypothetical protein AALD22_09335 [Lachnospiraceae bacterium 56-18]
METRKYKYSINYITTSRFGKEENMQMKKNGGFYLTTDKCVVIFLLDYTRRVA